MNQRWEVDVIQVDQAVFASSDRGSVKGYQLVARSEGIDRDTSHELCRWAPTQMAIHEADRWTINCFPLSDGRVAVTRTVLGGPEYSSRGGTQVVTLILVINHHQLVPYSYNLMLVAKTAMAMGRLRLPSDQLREHLPMAELPADPLFRPLNPVRLQSDEDPYHRLLDEVIEWLGQARRVAVIGSIDALATAERLIPRLSMERRKNFSFTTGLSPAVRRPFQVHFLDHADAPMLRTLDSQGIECVNAEKTLRT